MKFLEVEIFLQHCWGERHLEPDELYDCIRDWLTFYVLHNFCNQFETIVLHPYFVFFVICNENKWYDSQIIVSTCLSILRFLSYIFMPKTCAGY